MTAFQERLSKWYTIDKKLFKLKPSKTVLIIIDMTCEYSCPKYGYNITLGDEGIDTEYYFNRVEDIVVPNIRKLAAFFKRNNMKVIYTTFIPNSFDNTDLYRIGNMQKKNTEKLHNNGVGIREKGKKIREEIFPDDTDIIVNKVSPGAFYSSSLEAVLNNMKVETLFFTGVLTNVAVESTAREAVDRSYNTIIVNDACAALTNEEHESTVNIFRKYYGKVENTNLIIDEFPWETWENELI